jgi:protein phosphatase
MTTEVKLSIEYSGSSDIGLVRSENQDSFGKYPIGVMDIYSGKGQLFIIADGMGGHAGGKIASRLAVDTISKVYFSAEDLNTSEAVRNAIDQANKRIYWESENSDYNLAGMGTTCSVLVLKANKAVIGHVGDSRIYRIEDNNIEQLTEDHTQVNEMLKQGILSVKEAENYPLKTVLARAVGTDKQVKPDIIPDLLVKEGQSYILCTDGLGKVNPKEILEIVSSNSAAEASEKLVKIANERGGNDNVTVLVLKINSNQKDKSQIPVYAERRRNRSKILIFIAIIIVLIIAGILSIKSFPFFDPDKNDNNTVNKFDKKLKKSAINVSPTEEKSELVKKPAETEAAEDQLLEEADQFLEKDRIEDAAEIYKQILKEQPMHLGALDGLSKIALYYFHKAEELRFNREFKEALTYYLKMEELQPGNFKVIDLIKLCEYQIRMHSSDSN